MLSSEEQQTYQTIPHLKRIKKECQDLIFYIKLQNALIQRVKHIPDIQLNSLFKLQRRKQQELIKKQKNSIVKIALACKKIKSQKKKWEKPNYIQNAIIVLLKKKQQLYHNHTQILYDYTILSENKTILIKQIIYIKISMSKIILYGYLPSQVTRSVMTVLAIGKIDYQFIYMDGTRTRLKQFRQINPFMRIPFIKDGDFSLSQSNAILIYLCQKYSSLPKSLIGQNIKQRAIVNQYMSWYQNQFRPAYFEIIILKMKHLLTGEKYLLTQQHFDQIDLKMQNVTKSLSKFLELGGGDFLCGNKLTVADILIFYEFTNLQVYGKTWGFKFKYIQKWYNNVLKVPEVSEIMKKWSEQIHSTKQLLDSIKIQPIAKL